LEQALQIEQARVAVALQLALAVAGGADAAIQGGQLRPQQRLKLIEVAGHHGADGGTALRPGRSEMQIGQGGGHLLCITGTGIGQVRGAFKAREVGRPL
jgi:hypothetical protein